MKLIVRRRGTIVREDELKLQLDVDAIDTVLSVHSAVVTSNTIKTSLAQLEVYLSKFRKKFTPAHALHLKRLHVTVRGLDKYCDGFSAQFGGERRIAEKVIGVAELVSALGSKADSINLLEVVKYLKESKIARTVSCLVV